MIIIMMIIIMMIIIMMIIIIMVFNQTVTFTPSTSSTLHKQSSIVRRYSGVNCPFCFPCRQRQQLQSLGEQFWQAMKQCVSRRLSPS